MGGAIQAIGDFGNWAGQGIAAGAQAVWDAPGRAMYAMHDWSDPVQTAGSPEWLKSAYENQTDDQINKINNPDPLRFAREGVNEALAPVERPVNSFLTTNPVGQGVAPMLQSGVGYSTGAGFHGGMADPGIQPNTPTNAMLDKQTSDAVSMAPDWHPSMSGANGVPISPTTFHPIYDVGLSPMPPIAPTNSLGTSQIKVDPRNAMNTAAGSNGKPMEFVNGHWQEKGPAVGMSPIIPSQVGSGGTPPTSVGSTSVNIGGPSSNPSAWPTTNGVVNSDGSVSRGNLPENGGGSTVVNSDGTVSHGKSDAGVALESANTGGLGKWTDWVVPGMIGVNGLVDSLTKKAAADKVASGADADRALQEKEFNAVMAAQDAARVQQRTDAQPWLDAGKNAVGDLANFDKNHPDFGLAQMHADDGYAFRFSEGLKALQNSAAARGMFGSGNTGKALTKYGQDMGSEEYNNAFNRYNTQNNQKRGGLQSLAGLGQSAVQQTGQATQNYANNVGQVSQNYANQAGQATQAAANANASGYLGMGGAVTNALNSALSYQQGQEQNSMLRDILKRKTGS